MNLEGPASLEKESKSVHTTLLNVFKKGWKWALLAVVLCLIVYKVRFAPLPVSIQPVAVGDVVAEVMGTGTLEAHYQATVSAQIQSLITELLADQNDWVKAGQLLAKLDDSDLRREVAAQEAVVNASEATVERATADEARSRAIIEQARLDHNRYSGLLASKSISQEQMDKTVQGLAVAEAELARAFAATVEARRQQIAAQERLHFQQARLAYTRVTAPFDGLIVRRERQAGDIVVPGAPIFLLVSTKEMWITAYVDESAMDGLAPGQPARIVFRSRPAHEYSGKVTRLGQEVDRETREFRVDVGVNSLPTNWGVGQRAEVFIETGRKSAVTNIPVRTLVWRKGKPGVLVLNGGRANWKEVSLGLRGVDKVEITRGLSKGEMVIDGPEPSQLTDGQRVYSR